MAHTLEFKTPFSKQDVVLTMPNWGLTNQINREVDMRKLNSNEASTLLLSKIIKIDGVEATEEQLNGLVFKDYLYILEKWNDWEATDEKNG